MNFVPVCGGIYDGKSVPKQDDLDGTFCSGNSIYQDICGGICSSSDKVSRKSDSLIGNWDSVNANTIVQACPQASLSDIWLNENNTGQRKLASDIVIKGKTYIPKFSIMNTKGVGCETTRHRYNTLTSGYGISEEKVYKSLKCPKNVCDSSGVYLPDWYNTGCDYLYECGSSKVGVNASLHDITLSCWQSRPTTDEGYDDFFKGKSY